MTAFADFFSFNYLSWYEVIFRLVLAMALGFVIGYDRHSKNKPVDIRVYIIVCMATGMVSMMGQELYFDFADAENVVRVDLSHIISGTLTGIGFLGAGAILKQNNKQVIGSATGASIWASGGIGLSVGYGYYGVAILTASLIAVTLYFLGMFLKDEE